MGMSRCYSLMKCLLIIFNIIFFCCGGVLCVLCGWSLWEGVGVESRSGVVALCVVCAWCVCICAGAVAGVWGAVRRGGVYALGASLALLCVCGAGEGATLWWGLTHTHHLTHALHDTLQHIVHNEYGVVPSRTELIDIIQQELQCCGVDSVRDWQQSVWSGGETGALDLSVGAPATYYWVPTSCCARAGPTCEAARRVHVGAGGALALHSASCWSRVHETLSRVSRAPLALAAALLALHATTIPLTLTLYIHNIQAHTHKA